MGYGNWEIGDVSPAVCQAPYAPSRRVSGPSCFSLPLRGRRTRARPRLRTRRADATVLRGHVHVRSPGGAPHPRRPAVGGRLVGRLHHLRLPPPAHRRALLRLPEGPPAGAGAGAGAGREGEEGGEGGARGVGGGGGGGEEAAEEERGGKRRGGVREERREADGRAGDATCRGRVREGHQRYAGRYATLNLNPDTDITT